MPIHALSFCFWIKGMNHFSSPIMMPWKKSQPLTIYPFISHEEIFFSFKLVFLHQQVRNPPGTNFPVSQTFQFLPDGTVFYSNICWHFPHCHTDSLWWSLIFPLFLSVAAHLRSPLQYWSAMSVFPSLKCFTHCLTLLECMQEFPYAQWSCVWISSVVISSFQEILSLQVEEGGKKCRHQSFSRNEIWPHKGQVMWFSFQCEITKWNCSTYKAHCNIARHLSVIQQRPRLWVQPSYMCLESHTLLHRVCCGCVPTHSLWFFSLLVVECTQQQEKTATNTQPTRNSNNKLDPHKKPNAQVQLTVRITQTK